MKYSVTTIISVLLFSFLVGPVAAQQNTSGSAGKKEAVMERVQAKKDAVQEQKTNAVDRLKEKALAEIERRIAALTRLLDVLSKNNKLSSEQKTALSSQVQDEISGLNALKAKIPADTTVTDIRTDVAAIKKSYRVFSVIVPKIHIIIKAERTLALADKTSSLAAKLEQRISDLPEGASNKSELQTLLTSMEKYIDDAKDQAQQAIDTVTSLTPEGSTNRTSLMNARKLLRDSHKNLMAAHKVGKQIIKELRQNSVSDTPAITTASLTPTVAPTVTPTE